jgi:hypothetical protein
MTPETVCPTCKGRGHRYCLHQPEHTCPMPDDCPTCSGTGRIPAQGSETVQADHKTVGGEYVAKSNIYDNGRRTPKSPAEAEPGRLPDTSIPPTPAGEGELEQILIGLAQDSTTLEVGDPITKSAGFIEAKAAINAYIARRVLEVIGEDSHIHDGAAGDEATWEGAQNALRAEQRQRIAVIKKESQQ